ncbi:MarR family winged helix-turn-helix transcriptional regulator [Denitratisoma oestradiolicum]|uniref:Multiple antibiotic resistance protein marR (Modular protein) n=1 Tax=Denitratisoma oestradiolicum TaxID=311182 RepID=A0A6S6XNE3_9PROT|nr:MarR family transcriptional regulator [Denitratisoma oestradiolicum]TWO79694.1 hypothetical protein CBW56_13170 [Denitratisoma oestradiolicum]CAB1367451.1 Multiple antibiotic resistance protein marR (modular protein) [Denitratisoma oestradiolicum]
MPAKKPLSGRSMVDPDFYQAQQKMPLGFLMGMIANKLNRWVDAELAPWKITGSQWGVCRMINKGLGNTAADLSRRYGYDSGALARILQALENKGLIRRERSSDDQRRVNLQVTERGRTLIEESLPRIRHIGDITTEGFSAEEVKLFKDFLLRAHLHLAGDGAKAGEPAPAPASDEVPPLSPWDRLSRP